LRHETFAGLFTDIGVNNLRKRGCQPIDSESHWHLVIQAMQPHAAALLSLEDKAQFGDMG
ncbi:MAG: hypothetical protein WAZ19_01970, partial [Anaerolineae bacterium]